MSSVSSPMLCCFESMHYFTTAHPPRCVLFARSSCKTTLIFPREKERGMPPLICPNWRDATPGVCSLAEEPKQAMGQSIAIPWVMWIQRRTSYTASLIWTPLPGNLSVTAFDGGDGESAPDCSGICRGTRKRRQSHRLQVAAGKREWFFLTPLPSGPAAAAACWPNGGKVACFVVVQFSSLYLARWLSSVDWVRASSI